MKLAFVLNLVTILGRSRKGAWIEMLADQTFAEECDVAPVRERGLKYVPWSSITGEQSRSRKGAWIEIKMRLMLSVTLESLP